MRQLGGTFLGLDQISNTSLRSYPFKGSLHRIPSQGPKFDWICLSNCPWPRTLPKTMKPLAVNYWARCLQRKRGQRESYKGRGCGLWALHGCMPWTASEPSQNSGWGWVALATYFTKTVQLVIKQIIIIITPITMTSPGGDGPVPELLQYIICNAIPNRRVWHTQGTENTGPCAGKKQMVGMTRCPV